MKKLIAISLLALVVVTGCKYRVHPGFPIVSQGQYGTIIPGHPECVAEMLRSDLQVKPDGTYYTQEEWDTTVGWDFVPGPGYLVWLRFGEEEAYSSAEDSTGWNLPLCTTYR